MKIRLGLICDKAFEIFLLLTLFLTPLIFSPFFVRVFIVPKNFIFQLGTTFSALFFLCSLLFYHDLKFPVYKKRQYFFLFLSFLLLSSLFLSTIFAEMPAISLWGSYFRMQGFISFIHYFVFGLLVFFYVQLREKNTEKIIITIISSATLASVYAVYQKLGYDSIDWNDGELVGRVFGTFSNPSALALYLVASIPLTLAAFISFRLRFVSFIAFILQFVALFFSQTRGAALGLMVGLLIFFFFTAKVQQRKGFIKVILGLIAAIFILIGSINYFPESGIVKETPLLTRLIYNADNLRSLKVRAALWSSSYPLALQRPFWGYGADSFHYIYPQYRSQELNILEDINSTADRSHNELLDIAIFFGLPALAIYLALFMTTLQTIYDFVKKHRNFRDIVLAIGMGSALIAYFINNLFGFSLTPHYMLLATLMAMVMGFIVSKKSTRRVEPDFRFNRFTGYLSLILILTATVFLVHSIYIPPIKAELLHKRALQLFADPSKSSFEVLAPLEEAARTMPMYTEYAKNYSSLALTYLKDEKLSEAIREHLRTSTIEILNDANAKIPLDSYVYVFNGMIEGLIAAQEKSIPRFNSALWHFREAIALSPNDPNIYLQFGNVYYDNAKFGSAVEQYQKYLSLLPEYWQWENNPDNNEYNQQLRRVFYVQNPEFDQTLINLGRAYTSLGNFEKAIYYLNFARNTHFEKYVVLGDVYKFSDLFGKAVGAYNKALELSPDNPTILKALEEAKNGISDDFYPIIINRRK